MSEAEDWGAVQASIDVLDRKVSVTLATGGMCRVSPHDLRALVKIARRLDAARAAYQHERARIEQFDASIASAALRLMMVSFAVNAALKMVGLL